MGRAHDLMQTLPKKLADSSGYGPLEFVLLDYNSPDGLEQWVSSTLGRFVDAGRLTYAKTIEPKWYSVGHSRNLAFRVARGEIVCNVDADNWIGEGFVETIDRLAHEQPERAVFVKSRQLLRGRIGFYKREWDELLGGYDENMDGYGYDDRDLVTRAVTIGFKMKCFGGQYVTRLATSDADKVTNMKTKDWRMTDRRNRRISEDNIRRGILKANGTRRWGAARLTLNFGRAIEV